MGGMILNTSNGITDNMYCTGQIYWTGSPYSGWSTNRVMIIVDKTGRLGYLGLYVNSNSIRPVINLVKDITFSKGDGTSTNPFEI